MTANFVFSALKICESKGLNVKLSMVVRHMCRVSPPQHEANGTSNGQPAKRLHFDDKVKK